jgi:hypothetical protein
MIADESGTGLHYPPGAEPDISARQIADSVRLGMVFSREVACAQNMRF